MMRVTDMHQNPKNRFFEVAADTSTPLGRACKCAPLGYFQNDREIRELEVPSFGGHGNARAMARVYAMLAGDGEIDDVRLLSRQAVVRLSTLVWDHHCVMTKGRMRMGYGFMQNETETVPMGRNINAFGHTGTGGAFAWADRESNMSYCYVTNFQREGPGIGARSAGPSVAAGGGRAPSWLR
jgi:CubicO group peptidase (beta-lactamase class C family)